MADTNASLDFRIAWVNNPSVLLKVKPDESSESPDEKYVYSGCNGAYGFLSGYRLINSKLLMVEKILVGKDEKGAPNPKTEVIGEDVKENKYAARLAGCAARLDGQRKEEEMRTGKKTDYIGWAYEMAEGLYHSTSKVGMTDERVRKSAYEVEGEFLSEMSSEEKADSVGACVLMEDGGIIEPSEEDRIKSLYVPWLFGEKVETRVVKVRKTNRPVLGTPAPIRKGAGSFAFALMKDGILIGGADSIPIKLDSSVGMKRHASRARVRTDDLEKIKEVLSDKPMTANVIGEKVGMDGRKIGQILKKAVLSDIGGIKMINIRDEKTRKVRAAFYL